MAMISSGGLCGNRLAVRCPQVLRGGLSGKSTGVMMFALEHVARDPEKMAAMKRVYGEK